MTQSDLSPFETRCSSLEYELNRLLAHPRVEEIIANDWLHDPALPVPSVELIRYFAARILLGYGIKTQAWEQERYDLIASLTRILKEETIEQRKEKIPTMLRRLDCTRFLNTGKKGSDPFVHEWIVIVEPFLYPKTPDGEPDNYTYQQGERIVARGILETMTLRAIFTLDHRRLNSLAEATRIIAHNEMAPQSQGNRIRGEILRALPYLAGELARNPSRSELEFFIRNRANILDEEEFASDRTTWTTAFKDLEYPDSQRNIRLNESIIMPLVRKSIDP